MVSVPYYARVEICVELSGCIDKNKSKLRVKLPLLEYMKDMRILLVKKDTDDIVQISEIDTSGFIGAPEGEFDIYIGEKEYIETYGIEACVSLQ